MGTQVPGGTSAGEQSRRLEPAPPQRRMRLSYPRGRSPRKKPRAESAKTSAAARGGAQGGARPTRQPPQPAAAGKARAARGERSERRPAGKGRPPTASAGDRGNAAGGGERLAQPDRADPERAEGARQAEGAPERRASPAARRRPEGRSGLRADGGASTARGGARPTAARPRKKRRWDAEPGGKAAARLPRRGRLHKPPQRRREAEKRPRHRARDAATAGAPSTTEARERPKAATGQAGGRAPAPLAAGATRPHAKSRAANSRDPTAGSRRERGSWRRSAAAAEPPGGRARNDGRPPSILDIGTVFGHVPAGRGGAWTFPRVCF